MNWRVHFDRLTFGMLLVFIMIAISLGFVVFIQFTIDYTRLATATFLLALSYIIGWAYD